MVECCVHGKPCIIGKKLSSKFLMCLFVTGTKEGHRRARQTVSVAQSAYHQIAKKLLKSKRKANLFVKSHR
uniref:Uncharacterized protein n=1 Tax=Ascaris lumbricoides TaxID=6252 RepID=A0A9J2Q8A4_ASCLU